MGVNHVPGDSGKHYVMGVDLTGALSRSRACSAGSAPARGKRKGEREVGISLAASGGEGGREGWRERVRTRSFQNRTAAGCTGADPGGPKESSPFRNNLCRRRRGHFADGTGGRRTRTGRVMPSSGDRAGRNDDEKEEDDERKSLMTRSFFDDRRERSWRGKKKPSTFS